MIELKAEPKSGHDHCHCDTDECGASPAIDASILTDDVDVAHRVFQVRGLDCHEEVDLLRGTVGQLSGVSSLKFDVFHGRMRVEFSDHPIEDSTILAAISRAGLSGEPFSSESSGPSDSQKKSSRLQRLWIPFIGATWIAFGFALHALISGDLIDALHGEVPWELKYTPAIVCYLFAITAGGYLVFPRAWISLRSKRADMHVLMSAAVFGALALGLWLEGAMVMWLFTVAMALEAMIVSRARNAVTSLLSLAPKTAWTRSQEDDSWVEVSVETIDIGSKVRITPGERFPVDGVVLAGQSTAEESMLTGEVTPVDKSPADIVKAGAINGYGVLEVEATCRASDSTLARIIRLVQQAQNERSPSEQFIERFAAIYTPITIAFACAVALIPPLLFQASFTSWLEHALILLVVACPCALVIATPVAMVAAIASLARHGVLLKGARHLETASHIKAIAFDKTGTLTQGDLEVVEVLPTKNGDQERLLRIACSLSEQSQHPISAAIVQYAANKGVKFESASDAKALPGKGIVGEVGQERFWIGNRKLIDERLNESGNVTSVDRTVLDLEEFENAIGTLVFIFSDQEILGRLLLHDTTRPEAASTISDCRAIGVKNLVMLTGDRSNAAKPIADEVGVDEWISDALPEDKLNHIARLRNRYGTTAMVGDGINDGPALAAADVSFALGRKGADIASETSDIVFMNDRIDPLPNVILKGRHTISIIRQNVAFALGIKLFVVCLAWLGLGTIWMAVAADSGTSILVVLNALRLLRTSK